MHDECWLSLSMYASMNGRMMQRIMPKFGKQENSSIEIKKIKKINPKKFIFFSKQYEKISVKRCVKSIEKSKRFFIR